MPSAIDLALTLADDLLSAEVAERGVLGLVALHVPVAGGFHTVITKTASAASCARPFFHSQLR